MKFSGYSTRKISDKMYFGQKWVTFILSDESVLGFETAHSKDGLFIDLLTFQSIGMGNLELFCSTNFLEAGKGIFLRYVMRERDDPKARENFSVVVMPERLEVAMSELDDNLEAIPSIMSMVLDSIISAIPATGH